MKFEARASNICPEQDGSVVVAAGLSHPPPQKEPRNLSMKRRYVFYFVANTQIYPRMVVSWPLSVGMEGLFFNENIDFFVPGEKNDVCFLSAGLDTALRFSFPLSTDCLFTSFLIRIPATSTRWIPRLQVPPGPPSPCKLIHSFLKYTIAVMNNNGAFFSSFLFFQLGQ